VFIYGYLQRPTMVLNVSVQSISETLISITFNYAFPSVIYCHEFINVSRLP